MKTFSKLLLLIALLAYLAFAFVRMTGGADRTRCTAVNVAIADSLHAGFITAAEVERLLVRAGIHPKGREMDSIDGRRIEKVLLRNSFIKSANCFKTPGGRVNILISQRLPVMRVKAANGEDYYLDEAGHVMMPEDYNADLVVATGDIDKKYAGKNLVHIARYLQDHEFWNDQIVQIDVEPRTRNITLVPRVGSQLIRFGKADSATVESKFRNLKTFYDKVMPTVGWDTYREINLEYARQIICKRTETK